MKNILILSGFLLIVYSGAFSQTDTIKISSADTIKNGAYRNHIDFGKNKPMYESKFIFTYAFNRKIPELYKVSPTDSKVKRRAINKIVWGIYDYNTLYINASRIGMAKGYVKIEKLGRYSYFKGKPIISLSQQERLNHSSMFGLAGSAITGAQIAIENRGKIHYVLNLETGMVNLLTRNYLLMILQPYPELSEKYRGEENNESIEALLKYLDLVNKMDVVRN